jgi:hypothetical protein
MFGRFQVVPESWVMRIEPPSVAKHAETEGQEIPVIPSTPEGSVSLRHLIPVSDVLRTSPAFELSVPAA